MFPEGPENTRNLLRAKLVLLKSAVIIGKHIGLGFSQQLLLTEHLSVCTCAVSLIAIHKGQRNLYSDERRICSGSRIYQLGSLVAKLKVQIRTCGNFFESCLGLCRFQRSVCDAHLNAL